MPRPRTWTDDDLRRAVAEATSFPDVLRRLNLSPGGETYISVRVRIAELGLEASHLEAARRAERATKARRRRAGAAAKEARGRRRSWSDDDLRRAVAASPSYAQVLRRLELKPGGYTYVALKRRIAELGLDTGHMTGQGWAKGRRNPTPGSLRPLAEILVADSDYTNTYHLKRRLLKEGLKESRCESCGLTEWNGRPAPLQLDHVNGDRRDNRLENLRILCPNCHAQTDTWCSRNRGRYKNGK
ncbi:MAG: HNH endonuclease [Actinomycetota bacterium]|nr:HNH endonuclease [Actinomycetota bacterium]